MKITADTNVLVRVAVGDDPRQAKRAAAALKKAEAVVVPIPVLCERVWVLHRGYDLSRAEVATAIRKLTGAATVVVDRPAVDAGLALWEAGGDFADGAIEYAGRAHGAETFTTFDRKAARLLTTQARPVTLLR
ncbi:MAG: type II toxin-antitoxin system VapC family toxin [Bifidobacteriaceae bacterium]|jgi:predicted nucleic-acid-binding protein|nr:type II toxin-antitoxin system VapC family toxin [Bifidobacteriaceae bacterium]